MKEIGSCVFNSNVKNICNNIETKCKQLRKKNNIQIISIGIDATKYPKSLNLNMTRKCSIGGVFPNHIILTQYLGKQCMQIILNNKYGKTIKQEKIELALEVKNSVILFQNQPTRIYPMAIIAARLQGINEPSSFTSNIYKAARLVERDMEFVRFANFALDNVLVETYNILLTLHEFIYGKKNYCAVVDNKYNVKNNHYQSISRSNAATMSNYSIDTNLLLILCVSSELLVSKYFASNKKIQQLFYHKSLDQVRNAMYKAEIIRLEGDFDIICTTQYSY